MLGDASASREPAATSRQKFENADCNAVTGAGPAVAASAAAGRLPQEAYTPTAIDPVGRIYPQNNGQMYVLGH